MPERKKNGLMVQSVKPLPDMMIIITFDSGEERLFDANRLLAYPAFQPLSNETIFMNPKVEYGVVTWANGEIDIAPETMYESSFEFADSDV